MNKKNDFKEGIKEKINNGWSDREKIRKYRKKRRSLRARRVRMKKQVANPLKDQ
jgi:hypothetical protein